MEQKSSRVVKWSLVFGIVIVLNLFFNYSLSVVYKSPQYNNFCPIQQVPQVITTQEQCLNVGGQWSQSGVITADPGVPEKTSPKMSFYCNPDYTCNINYQAAQNIYDRNVFITLVALGVLIVLLSFALKNNEVLSASFSLGGVLSFIVASVRYWSSANDLIKMIILGIALAILIYLAYRKFSVSTSHESKI
jgi:VIT1/CCC1 family predicted Fe2+/Mn2+ transporter